MKQSAVEWLIEQVNSDEYQKAFGQTYISIALLEQALEMEKEQIMDAYLDGCNDIRQDKYMGMHEYYNETYKPKKP